MTGVCVPSPVAVVLEERTSDVHHRIEKMLDLAGPDLSTDRLRQVLERFAGFWQGSERSLDDWAAGEPALAARLSWSRRRRGEVLRTDLLRLGATVRQITALPEAPPVFTVVDSAAALGWLYVSERATLGGTVIDVALQGRAGLHLRSFAPYLEGPGPMWRSYLRCLRDWVADDDERLEDVVVAAERTFAAVEQWLGALSDDEGPLPVLV
jgi:heme oxygenase